MVFATVAREAPLHARLDREGSSATLIRQLVLGYWIRTPLWTVNALLLLALTAQFLAAASQYTIYLCFGEISRSFWQGKGKKPMATHLTPEEMKAFVRRHFEDFVNNKKAEVIRHNMTPDFYDHDGPDGKPAGVEVDENMMRRMYDLMPDIQITIEDMVAEGDKVVCRNIWRWKDAKSGTPMEFHGFVQWRFEGNLIAERWATVTTPREASK